VRRRGLAFLVGILAAFVLVGLAEGDQRAREATSFVVVPDLGYARLPGTVGWVEGRQPTPRDPGRPRIVCVGDSVTEGVGVAPRDAWPGVLGQELDAEVLDFGVNGWDASQAATLLETRIAAWNPDLVVWGAYANDIFRTYAVALRDRPDLVFVAQDVPAAARILPDPVARWLLPRSALFRRIQGAAYARAIARGHAPPPDLAAYADAVDRMERWSASTRIPLLILAIPPHIITGPCADCDGPRAWFAAITGVLGTHAPDWIDGEAAWRGKGPFYLPGSRDPDHPSAAGHALLADEVAPRAREILDARHGPS
jgi:lysophospholipase L1-like esterase